MFKKTILTISIFIFFIIAIVIIFSKLGYLKINSEFKISDILTFCSVIIATAALGLTAYNADKNFKVSQAQIRNANKQLKITEQQLQDNEKEKKGEQAVKVASWITDLSATTKVADSYGNTLASEITIQNSSETPVYKTFIFTLSNRYAPSYSEVKINPTKLVYIETLQPGKRDIKLRSDGAAMGGVHESVAMIFTDSNSNIWYRDNYGKLTYISQQALDAILKRSRVPGPYNQFFPLP